LELSYSVFTQAAVILRGSERNDLREAMTDIWGDLAYALGGWSGCRDRGIDKFWMKYGKGGN
jgi:hypothetical protein